MTIRSRPLIEVPAVDVGRAFDRFLDIAEREAVVVRRSDSERVVVMAIAEYERLTSGTRSVTIACGSCGSTKVSRDAWADWDAERQDWVLGAVFDAGHCHACEEDAGLIELPLDARVSVAT